MTSLPVRPTAVLGVATAVAGRVRGAVVTVLTLPGRALALIEGAEDVLDRVNRLVAEIERVAARADAIVVEADLVARRAGAVAEDAGRVARAAGGTVAGAGALTDRAGALLAVYEPPLTALRPTVERLAESTDPREVEAMVDLVDRLPVLLDSMEKDVLPLLGQLNVMAPDLHSLLLVMDDVRTTLAGIPGFGRLRRRGEEELAAEDD